MAYIGEDETMQTLQSSDSSSESAYSSHPSQAPIRRHPPSSSRAPSEEYQLAPTTVAAESVHEAQAPAATPAAGVQARPKVEAYLADQMQVQTEQRQRVELMALVISHIKALYGDARRELEQHDRKIQRHITASRNAANKAQAQAEKLQRKKAKFEHNYNTRHAMLDMLEDTYHLVRFAPDDQKPTMDQLYAIMQKATDQCEGPITIDLCDESSDDDDDTIVAVQVPPRRRLCRSIRFD